MSCHFLDIPLVYLLPYIVVTDSLCKKSATLCSKLAAHIVIALAPLCFSVKLAYFIAMLALLCNKVVFTLKPCASLLRLA